MIGLRNLSERWLRHPALGPVLLLLIVVALAFLVVHESGESPIESMLAGCVTLAALGAAVVSLRRGSRTVRIRSGPILRPLVPQRYVSSGERPPWPYALRL